MRTGAVVVATLLLTVQSLVIASAAFAALLSSLMVWWVSGTSAAAPSVDAFIEFHLKMLATFVTAAMFVFVFRVSASEALRPIEVGSAALSAVTLCLVMLALWVALSSGPWRSMWRESLGVLEQLGVWNRSDWFGLEWLVVVGVLLLPGLLALAAAALVLASTVTLILLCVRSAAANRALIQCVAVGAACLVASCHTTALLERWAEAALGQSGDAPLRIAQQAEAWVRANEEQAIAATERLTWQVAAYLLLVPMVLLGTRRLSDDEAIEAHPPGAVPPPVEAGGDLNVRDLRRCSIYILRPRGSRFLGLLPGRHPYAISGPAYEPSEQVLFQTEERGGEVVLRLAGGRPVLSVQPRWGLERTTYRVLSPNGQTLATFERRHLSGRHWVVLDHAGIVQGAADRLGTEWELTVRGRRVASLVWRLVGLRPEMEVSFPPDPEGRLDRRLALALAIITESKTRFWSHV